MTGENFVLSVKRYKKKKRPPKKVTVKYDSKGKIYDMQLLYDETIQIPTYELPVI
jgi:hypothetical protein